MGKAEVGTPKYIDNRSKQKGLTKLNFYCSVCQRAMRDENGFKMHTQSESHVRRVEEMGQDARTWIEDHSAQFLRDFISLLKTAHCEKQVHINHFYQEFIADKHHVHMNGTKWRSLTEFAKYLGHEGICTVDDREDKGVFIGWIDDSADAIRRRDILKRRTFQDQADELIQERLIQDQIKRAKRKAGEMEDGDEEADRELKRVDGEKITLSFGGGSRAARRDGADGGAAGKEEESGGKQDGGGGGGDGAAAAGGNPKVKTDEERDKGTTGPGTDLSKPNRFGGISLKPARPQTRNVFGGGDDEGEGDADADAALAAKDKKGKPHSTRHFASTGRPSAAQRIMQEERERMRSGAGGTGGGGGVSFGLARKR